MPPRADWERDTRRPRYANGLILAGFAGVGKTAFLARQVERLLAPEEADAGRDHLNLVLFLRGDGIAHRPGGVSLFQDVAEKLGVAVDGVATTRARREGGFSSFRDLLEHLHQRWLQDRLEGRRFLLILDAVNEAVFPEQLVDQALELIGWAACYPWCKVVLSTRQEWLTLWTSKMGAHEASPLSRLRSCLFVAETGRPGRPEDLPTVSLPAFTLDQAGQVYAAYQKAAGAADGQPAGACLTPWERLSQTTRNLLLNPLHLHLFMEAFAGRPAATVDAVPDLFRLYVERSLAEHPGLRRGVGAVLDYLLDDLARQGANLDDDDYNAIRRAWAEGRSEAEIRAQLSPVEALCQEGFLSKRVREEGGGYRFVFQKVAEYLLYVHLAEARPPREDELAYWRRRAEPEVVFFEYAAAFAFLFRHWAQEGRWAQIGPLVEDGAPWLTRVLFEFLWEQALTATAPGQASPGALALAEALEKTGGRQCGLALQNAADHLAPTHYLHTALTYYPAAIALLRQVPPFDPGQPEADCALAAASYRYGSLLTDAWRWEEAEANLERCVTVAGRLWQADPFHHTAGAILAVGWRERGQLWTARGLPLQAGDAYRRAVEVAEQVQEAHPDQEASGQTLGIALLSLGGHYLAQGELDRAEAVFLRTLAFAEGLARSHPTGPAADLVGSACESLGRLKSAQGDAGGAEQAFRRAHQCFYERWLANEGNLDLGFLVIHCLQALGNVLHDVGRLDEAEENVRKTLAFLEDWRTRKPDSLRIHLTLAHVHHSLAALLASRGRLDEAEAHYRTALAVIEPLSDSHPDHLGVGQVLARARVGLGHLLLGAGKLKEAKAAYREAVRLLQELRRVSSSDRESAQLLVYAWTGLGAVQHSFGGELGEAEHSYRQAVAVAEELAGPTGDGPAGRTDPDAVLVGRILADALDCLATWLWAVGRSQEAEAAYERQVVLRRDLWRQCPQVVEVGLSLVRALKSLASLRCQAGGLSPEALTLWQEALDLLRQQQAQSPGHVRIGIELADLHLRLGGQHHTHGRLDEAQHHYEATSRVAEPWWQEHPEYPEFGKKAAGAAHGWGQVQKDRSRLREAERAFHQAQTLYEQVAARHPREVDANLGLARVLHSLGMLLKRTHRTGEAEAAYRRGLAITAALVEADPQLTAARDQRGMTLLNLGYLLPELGRFDQAEQADRQTITLFEDLIKEDSRTLSYAVSLGLVWDNLGILQTTLGRAAEAEASLRQALDILEPVHREQPAHQDGLNGFLWTLTDLGWLHARTGRREQAETFWSRVHQVCDPLWEADLTHPLAGRHLGRVLTCQVQAGAETADVDQVEALCHRGLDVYQGLLQFNDLDREVRGEAALLATASAAFLIRTGRTGRAGPLAELAVDFLEDLHRREPGHFGHAGLLARAYLTRAEWREANEETTRAETDYRLALAILQDLAARCPQHVEIGSLLGRTRAGLAAILGREKGVEVSDLFREALAGLERLWAACPEFLPVGAELGRGLTRYGDWLWTTGAQKEAGEVASRAFSLYDHLAARDPANLDHTVGLAWSLSGLGKGAQARALVQEVMQHVPEHAEARQVQAAITHRTRRPARGWRLFR
ncbi:MAG: tetratricopeptide repeat protein [Planctomycetes bacterium]|nr:tetratricopeptide repeat protein [Planctomycetota bacterium]